MPTPKPIVNVPTFYIDEIKISEFVGLRYHNTSSVPECGNYIHILRGRTENNVYSSWSRNLKHIANLRIRSNGIITYSAQTDPGRMYSCSLAKLTRYCDDTTTVNDLINRLNSTVVLASEIDRITAILDVLPTPITGVPALVLLKNVDCPMLLLRLKGLGFANWPDLKYSKSIGRRCITLLKRLGLIEYNPKAYVDYKLSYCTAIDSALVNTYINPL